MKRPCRQCGSLIDYTDKFCYNCGTAIETFCVCGKCIKPDFKYCPACGKNQRAEPETSVSLAELSSAPQQLSKQDMLTDVKKRLMLLQGKRQASIDNPFKKVKRELVVHIGIKQAGTMKLQKKFGGMKKVSLERHSSYITCIEAICNSFSLQRQDQMFLVDNGNKKILQEHFTLENYVKNYSYVGATRLYLVVDLDNCWSEGGTPDRPSEADTSCEPPNLTPQVTPEKAAMNEQLKSHSTSKAEVENVTPPQVTLQKAAVNEQLESHSTSKAEVENVTSVTVKMEEVEDFLREELKEDQADQTDESLVGELKKRRGGFTPMHTRNVCVQYFLDAQAAKGVEYEVVQSGWGRFVLVPDKDIDLFFKVRKDINFSKMVIVSPPLLYFFGTYEKELAMHYVSENVIKLDDDVMNDYNKWKDVIKSGFETM